MRRDTALRLVTGQRDPDTQLPEVVALAAERLDVSRSWVYRWPDELPRQVCDRVLGYLVRVEAAVMRAKGERLPPMHVDACALNHPDDVKASSAPPRAPPAPRRKGRPPKARGAANDVNMRAA